MQQAGCLRTVSFRKCSIEGKIFFPEGNLLLLLLPGRRTRTTVTNRRPAVPLPSGATVTVDGDQYDELPMVARHRRGATMTNRDYTAVTGLTACVSWH